MNPHVPVELPIDPNDILLQGLQSGLEQFAVMYENLPWPVKLVVTILILARIFKRRREPTDPHSEI